MATYEQLNLAQIANAVGMDVARTTGANWVAGAYA
jgi:hypothetical protein